MAKVAQGTYSKPGGKLRMRIAVAFLIGLSLAASASPSSAAITFVDLESEVYVRKDLTEYSASDSDPVLATASVSPEGFSSTTTTSIGPLGIFMDFDQSRLGGFGDATSGTAFAFFTVTTDYAYSISGTYTNSSGTTNLQGDLFDSTDGVFLFWNPQESHGGPTTFTLGSDQGTDFSRLEGNLTGVLQAGHSYEFRVQMQSFIGVGGDEDGGAQAAGSALLGLAAVPEPASVLIWSGIAAVGLIAGCRRRKRPA